MTSAAALLAAVAVPGRVLDARGIAVVAAHPDDDVLGAGGLLPRLAGVRVIYVTNGAPRAPADARAAGFAGTADYASARRREAEAALTLAGVARDRIVWLDLDDQDASFQLVALTRQLQRLGQAFACSALITHAYEGGHPDHDATAFAVHAAAAAIARARGTAPAIIEMATYHAGPAGLATHDFLPGGPPTHTLALDTEQQCLKAQMLACHATQWRTLAPFGVACEKFRAAPEYDFTRPPHPGTLWYERFAWGVRDGAAWRALAGAALAELRSAASTSDGPAAASPLTVLSVAYPFAPVGVDAVGGAEQVLSLLDHGLAAAGHRSLVIAAEGSSVAGELLATPCTSGIIDAHARAQAHAAHRRAIDAALTRYPVDVVHLHGCDFDAYLPTPSVPVLVTIHLPPHWHAPAALRPTRPDTWLHGVSAAQHRSFPSYTRLLPPIDNGIDIARLQARHGKRGFALFLGRVCPEKGVHVALDAARHAGRSLLVAGEVFPYKAHQHYFLREVAPRLDRFWRYLGPVSLARKRRLLTSARCLLVPSLVPETSSLVAMEALACGTPVVAFRAGALANIVEHGRTGFLVDNVGEMALAIEATGRLDPQACREAAYARFAKQRMIARYVARYRALVRLRTAA